MFLEKLRELLKTFYSRVGLALAFLASLFTSGALKFNTEFALTPESIVSIIGTFAALLIWLYAEFEASLDISSKLSEHDQKLADLIIEAIDDQILDELNRINFDSSFSIDSLIVLYNFNRKFVGEKYKFNSSKINSRLDLFKEKITKFEDAKSASISRVDFTNYFRIFTPRLPETEDEFLYVYKKALELHNCLNEIINAFQGLISEIRKSGYKLITESESQLK